jgi:hypothetical protein
MELWEFVRKIKGKEQSSLPAFQIKNKKITDPAKKKRTRWLNNTRPGLYTRIYNAKLEGTHRAITTVEAEPEFENITYNK